MVYLCDACHAPIFLRFTVRVYGAARIELSPQFTEVERAREKFSFTYIPEDVELLFREALTCFSNGAFNAFASMCRRAAQAMFSDLGEAGKLRLFDELNAVRDLASIAPEIFTKMKNVLFGAELDARSALPLLDGYEAGIMLEVVKDLLLRGLRAQGQAAAGHHGAALLPRRDRQTTSRRSSPPAEAPQPTKRRALRNSARPAAVLAGVARLPGVLHVAERALRVRHGDGDAAVRVDERRDAEGRAARVGRIGAGHAAVVIDVAQRRPGRSARRLGGRLRGANSARPSPCATAIGSTRARHAREQHGRRLAAPPPARSAPRTARCGSSRSAASARCRG